MKIKRCGKAVVLAFLVTIIVCADVDAAPVDSIDAGRKMLEFKREQEIRLAPDATRGRAAIQVPATDGLDIPSGAEKVRIDLEKIILTGDVRAYTPADLAQAYAGYEGREVSLADVFGIAARLTRKYQSDGYVLSRVVIPAQAIDEKKAAIRLHVIEGYIQRVDINGDYADSGLMRRLDTAVREMRPFNIKRFETWLWSVNDAGAVAARAVLKPIPESADAGAVALEILLERRNNRYELSANNHGSRYQGPYQARAHAEWVNVGTPFAMLAVDAALATQTKELRIGSFSYALPLTATGLSLTLSGGHTRSEPGKELRALEIKSKSTFASVEMEYSALRTRSASLSFSGELYANNSATDTVGGAPLSFDRLRVVRAGVNADRYDSWNGSNAVSLDFSKGLNALGARETGSPDLSRALGVSDFEKIEMSLSRVQYIGACSVLVAVTGQYAFDALLASEEFGFGGMGGGRGYDSSEITGDHGVSGMVELRLPALRSREVPAVVAQPFVFVDAGKVWNIDAGNESHESAVSAGAGFRAAFGEDVSAELVVASPLTHKAASRPYGNPEAPRVFLSVTSRF